MSKYIATGTDLTSVANAIRTAGGTSSPLQFPSGFVSAIQNIPSGGGGDTPSGYTRLKYLESSGTQCIDTGKYSKLNSKYVCKCCYIPGAQGSYAYILGSGNPTVGPLVVSSSAKFETNVSYSSFGSVTDKTVSPNAPLWCDGVMTLTKDGSEVVYQNDSNLKCSVSFTGVTLSENQNSHICLFCRGNNGNYERFAKARIYEYWYYENDVLIQHMIPVKRDSDDVLGMYELVGSTFFVNAGTGTFIGGT